MTSRRRFIQIVPLAGASLMVAQAALAADEMVSEKDPQAAALGYVADATKADKAKFKQYAAGHTCANCALFKGKPTDAAGGCPLYGTRLVSSKGWCSAWSKKS
jgi:hypothetical protein